MERRQRLERELQSYQILLWLQKNYRIGKKGSLGKNEVFLDYVSMCQQTNTQPLFSHAVFGKLVKRAFPGIKTNRKGPRGQSKQHYTLLCRAKPTQKQCKHEHPVPSSVPAPAPATTPTIKKETIPQTSTCQQQQQSQMRGMPNYSNSACTFVECNLDEEFFDSTNSIHHECPDHATLLRDTKCLTSPIECLTSFISPYENNLLHDLQECGFTSSHDSISSFYSSLDSLPQADLLPGEEFHSRPSTVGHSYLSLGQLPQNPTIYGDNSTSLLCVSRHSDYYSNTFCYRHPSSFSSERSSFDEHLALGDLPLLDQSPGIPAYAPHPPCSSNWIVSQRAAQGPGGRGGDNYHQQAHSYDCVYGTASSSQFH